MTGGSPNPALEPFRACRMMTAIPPALFAHVLKGSPRRPVRVWMSERFVAYLYTFEEAWRLTVQRHDLDEERDRWADGITWDELQRVKNECGFDDRWAVEVFPPTEHTVNVANLRHLWLLREAPDFAWKKE